MDRGGCRFRRPPIPLRDPEGSSSVASHVGKTNCDQIRGIALCPNVIILFWYGMSFGRPQETLPVDPPRVARTYFPLDPSSTEPGYLARHRSAHVPCHYRYNLKRAREQAHVLSSIQKLKAEKTQSRLVLVVRREADVLQGPLQRPQQGHRQNKGQEELDRHVQREAGGLDLKFSRTINNVVKPDFVPFSHS